MLQIQYCSSWMDPRFILGSRLKQFFSQLLAVFLSHLMGMFYRTIRMLEHGIKPVYVFDGKPPQLKSAEVCMGSDFHRCHSPWQSDWIRLIVIAVQYCFCLHLTLNVTLIIIMCTQAEFLKVSQLTMVVVCIICCLIHQQKQKHF